MALANYTAEVKDNLLLELPAEAGELNLKPGAKIRVQLAFDDADSSRVRHELVPVASGDDEWMQAFDTGHIAAGVSLTDEQTRREVIYDY